MDHRDDMRLNYKPLFMSNVTLEPYGIRLNGYQRYQDYNLVRQTRVSST